MMKVSGGRAHIHGVSFENEKWIVRSVRDENQQIKTTVVEKRWRNFWFERLFDVPFLRGLLLYLEVFIQMWKVVVALFIAFFLFYGATLLFLSSEKSVAVLHGFQWTLKVLKVALVIYLIYLFRRSSLAKYHGAEHKVYNCFVNQKPLVITRVREESRLSRQCGTNLLIFIVFCYLLFTLVIHVSGLLRLVLSLSCGYELFLISPGEKGQFRRALFSPFYLLGSFLQKYIFTAEPEDKELEVALAAMNRLLSID